MTEPGIRAVDLSDGCTACYAEADLALLAGDVAAVPDELVVSALSEPSDHWKPEQWRFLFRRFTPRLPALVRAGAHDEALLLRGFGRWFADLASWPADERREVEAVLADVLREALATRPADDVVRLLGGLACVDDDIRPWLARLDANQAEAGIVRLASHWAVSLLWGEDDWFAWWYPDDPVTPVREWTLSARPVVAAFAARHPDCKTARDGLIAYDRLARGMESPWFYPGRPGLPLA
ncbi:hypothetical protein [Amycolatopsis nalaikhensis]|uniref:Uncharacterized protein n=1 Tax=Amycolatopsis nalaikhensis TaxID=715472 RepID=A0ABY8XK75_9PSEU|nr:hypothetical protein [Amycolatopsis sp. 2-2]WIV56045.1 hypothetical protein QP939_45835 [Amycolatopsis sp. 2-2]